VIDSYNTEALAKKMSVVRQEFVPAFEFSVIQTVMMARTPYFTQIGFETKTDAEIVNAAMEATDTARFASRRLGNLSGGERQRVFIARALAQNTPVVLLDEPTSFLDLKHQVRIYDLLKTAQLEKGKTVVAVTHDINLAAQYADVALMLDGSCGYRTGKLEDVFTRAQIEGIFGLKVFAGKVGDEKFFLPLGKLAKDRRTVDADGTNRKE
jgi:iron complex transport system ATP-binding protein